MATALKTTDADVDEIIAGYQRTAPVDVEAIAARLGIDVAYRDLGPGISGRVAKGRGGRFDVVVNRNDHPLRQRFTVAHEIAHCILHAHLFGDGLEDDVLYRSKLPSRLETEANEKAADILMPWHLINHLMDNRQLRTVGALAGELQVTRTAMAVRLGVPT